MVESVLYTPSALERVDFLSKGVQPPSNVYIGKDDCLFITTYSSIANLRIDVRGRILLASGRATVFEFSNVPNSNRTENTVLFALGEGWMLNVAAFLGSGSCKRGQCYVVIGLAQGKETSNFKHTIIAQGYVGTQVNQAWPGNRLEQPTEGAGVIRRVPGTNPSAGQEIAETVPTGARWRLLSLFAALVTNVNVANRRPVFLLGDAGSLTFFNASAPAVQAASLTTFYCLAPGLGFESAPDTSRVNVGIPVSMMLGAGYHIDTLTTNLQAGDDWGAPSMLVEEWIEP
jgi:hypothetical protein